MRATPLILLACALLAAMARAQPVTPAAGPNFATDIAPILQQKCETCHRPGTSAPMPLTTYAQVRPWIRAIRQSVTRREMPPWPVVSGPGARRFKNDRSLTESQIALLVRWIDAGAPPGDTRDLPPPLSWPDDQEWRNGTPDVILSLPPRRIAAAGPDTWIDIVIDPALAEDRYIKAVETKPSADGRRAVHHVVTHLVEDGAGDSDAAGYLSEYALGKDVELFPDQAGRLIKAGARLRVNVHDHPSGLEITDRMQIGLFLHPREVTPKHRVMALTVGLLVLDDDLDIPAHSAVTHHATARLAKAARLISLQPHMHRRGKAMTLEAVLPDGTREALGAVDRYDFGMQTSYIYEDDDRPVLPAGTTLHATATYDNTAANRSNPDPGQWVGFGNRSIDEMFQCHVLMIEIDDAEYRSSRDRLTPPVKRPPQPAENR
jgi:hypothetical protein